MKRVESGRSWRGDPRSIGAGLGMCYFLFEHGGHQVRHCPHPFTDLCAAAQPARQAGQHIAAFVGGKPCTGFHIALADHRSRLHGGMHFIAGAVEKPGVDKCYPRGRFVDTCLEVDARATFFVHDAKFDRICR